ncbi:hypothetical protein [Ammoniphilus sp. YIM 78166]|uniref:hypothetical protein n=1 Tax=Ammoniphilus sp. YIM 78166 TaxID=1644106 RepID=UPI00106F2871|nr:hypothetical protein [Ammoniphilus sp. YIM 78166]
MSLTTCIRWLGLFAVLGGLCRAAMTPLELAWGVDNTPALLIGGITGSIFIIFGTVGIYLYQAEKTGLLGFIAFFISVLGNILVCTMVAVALFVNTELNNPQILDQEFTGPIVLIRMLMMISMSVGYVLLGYVTLRAKMLPSWAAGLMILFVFMVFIPFVGDYLALIWGLIYIRLGWAVWSHSAKDDASKATS